MISQLTDERIFYHTRKTVLEMLRDRDYEIGDDEINETYEDLEKKYLTSPKIVNFIARRPVQGSMMEVDEGAKTEQMMEPIYVKFIKKEEKLSHEQINEIVCFMSGYSKTGLQKDTQELQHAILITKSQLKIKIKKRKLKSDSN
jgi:hypothetical protein